MCEVDIKRKVKKYQDYIKSKSISSPNFSNFFETTKPRVEKIPSSSTEIQDLLQFFGSFLVIFLSLTIDFWLLTPKECASFGFSISNMHIYKEKSNFSFMKTYPMEKF